MEGEHPPATQYTYIQIGTSPSIFKIFSKFNLALFTTGLSRYPTAAKCFSASLSLLIGVAGLA